jgi:hypothetical protein
MRNRVAPNGYGFSDRISEANSKLNQKGDREQGLGEMKKPLRRGKPELALAARRLIDFTQSHEMTLSFVSLPEYVSWSLFQQPRCS